jgi:hypothetical protein
VVLTVTSVIAFFGPLADALDTLYKRGFYDGLLAGVLVVLAPLLIALVVAQKMKG